MCTSLPHPLKWFSTMCTSLQRFPLKWCSTALPHLAAAGHAPPPRVNVSDYFLDVLDCCPGQPRYRQPASLTPY